MLGFANEVGFGFSLEIVGMCLEPTAAIDLRDQLQKSLSLKIVERTLFFSHYHAYIFIIELLLIARKNESLVSPKSASIDISSAVDNTTVKKRGSASINVNCSDKISLLSGIVNLA